MEGTSRAEFIEKRGGVHSGAQGCVGGFLAGYAFRGGTIESSAGRGLGRKHQPPPARKTTFLVCCF